MFPSLIPGVVVVGGLILYYSSCLTVEAEASNWEQTGSLKNETEMLEWSCHRVAVVLSANISLVSLKILIQHITVFPFNEDSRPPTSARFTLRAESCKHLLRWIAQSFSLRCKQSCSSGAWSSQPLPHAVTVPGKLWTCSSRNIRQ